MSDIPHLPALRRGRPYESLDKSQLVDHSTGNALVSISQVNAGIVRKDMARIAESRATLKRFTVAQMLEICSRAGDQFLNAMLPLGDKGHTQPRSNTWKRSHAPAASLTTWFAATCRKLTIRCRTCARF
jgi:hypothetical protein